MANDCAPSPQASLIGDGDDSSAQQLATSDDGIQTLLKEILLKMQRLAIALGTPPSC